MNRYIFKRYVLFSLMLFCFSSLFSQVSYPVDSSFISTLSNAEKNNLKGFSYSSIDTSIFNLHNYMPRNTSGNLGLPSAPLYIEYQAKPLGFNFYQAPYKNDIIHSDNIGYYQTKGPYASLTGIAGSKQEQAFKLLFSNSFKKKLNVTLGFNRYGATGFYTRQQTFTNNFYVSSNYTNKTNRVGYYSYFLFNKLKHFENGGIVNDSLFLANVFVNKLLLPITLTNAKRSVRHLSADINPWVRLNKKDSATVFSHFVDYDFNYSDNYTTYTDLGIASDNYYQVFYFDTLATKDSAHWAKLSNGINYTLKINPLHVKLKFGIKNEFNKVHQYIDSSFINNSINTALFFDYKSYSGFAKASYIINGANQNDYSLEISNSYTTKFLSNVIKSPLVFGLSLQAEQRHPDFIYNTWFSNHYIWHNNFSPLVKQQAMFSIYTANHRFDIGVVAQNHLNYLYFNGLALPDQTTQSIQNLSFYIHKDVLVLKHLGISAKYNYQTSSYEAIISVPNHVVNGALYYQGNLFKKALQLQVGLSAQYYSEFYGYSYKPSTNMYYVQTQEKVGNYPYMDFFLNARIKPVRFFIKIEHLNQGFFGTHYLLTPGYLQNDRAFKAGINWLFFD